jgi:hypothetical protein
VSALALRRSPAFRDWGLGDASVWPSDLLAYRQQWEPFIKAHLELWRYLNSVLESVPDAQQCPAGIFNAAPSTLSLPMQQFCAALAITRIRVSDTDPDGIQPQWNAWKGKSSAEILAGTGPMLKWHEGVVLRTGGQYKDDLVRIAKTWNIPHHFEFPPTPPFSEQQDIITRIEGAGLAAQGLLQIIGYSTGEVLVGAANTTQALAEGLRDTAKAIPKVLSNPWTWIGVAAVAAVAGGVLLTRYAPPPQRSPR